MHTENHRYFKICSWQEITEYLLVFSDSQYQRLL